LAFPSRLPFIARRNTSEWIRDYLLNSLSDHFRILLVPACS
jgi:hypothetical protein